MLCFDHLAIVPIPVSNIIRGPHDRHVHLAVAGPDDGTGAPPQNPGTSPVLHAGCLYDLYDLLRNIMKLPRCNDCERAAINRYVSWKTWSAEKLRALAIADNSLLRMARCGTGVLTSDKRSGRMSAAVNQFRLLAYHQIITRLSYPFPVLSESGNTFFMLPASSAVPRLSHTICPSLIVISTFCVAVIPSSVFPARTIRFTL